jgi:hypothetical protein
MQVLTSLAVLMFFRKNVLPIGKGLSFFAPLLSALGMIAALVLATCNLGLIAGTDSKAMFVLMILRVTIGAAGWMYRLTLPSIGLSLETGL